MVEQIIGTLISAGPPLAQTAETGIISGPYISLIKWLVMVVMVVPWLYLAPKAFRDAQLVGTKANNWAMMILGAGLLSLFVWLLIPVFVAGLVIYIVLVGATFGAYAAHRNGRVPQEGKILTPAHIKSMLSGRRQGEIAVEAKLKLYARGHTIVLEPSMETSTADEIHAYNLTQHLLYDIAWHRASEARLSPQGEQTRIHYVVDGVPNEQDPIPVADSEAIIQYLKYIGGMEVDEMRRPQEGRIAIEMTDKPIDVEMATTGTTGGQEIRFRVVQQAVQTDLDQLGMAENLLEAIKAHNQETSGVIIISGPRGTGITSTLYSLVRQHDAFMKQMFTLEAKPAVDLENITQYAYGEPENLTEELAGALRRDPDVMVVDGCEDPKAMQLAAEAAGQKMLLLGIRASDSFTALAKWVKGIGNSEAAMTNLKVILCQRLLRSLCPTCREAYRPDPLLLAKINMPADGVEEFYRPNSGQYTDDKGKPSTCPTCQGSGYFGRTAIFEMLEVTDDIRKMVTGGTSLSQIKAACRKNKMLYLQEQGLRKAIDGSTSVQEVIRVTEPQKKKRSSQRRSK